MFCTSTFPLNFSTNETFGHTSFNICLSVFFCLFFFRIWTLCKNVNKNRTMIRLKAVFDQKQYKDNKSNIEPEKLDSVLNLMPAASLEQAGTEACLPLGFITSSLSGCAWELRRTTALALQMKYYKPPQSYFFKICQMFSIGDEYRLLFQIDPRKMWFGIVFAEGLVVWIAAYVGLKTVHNVQPSWVCNLPSQVYSILNELASREVSSVSGSCLCTFSFRAQTSFAFMDD